jgi:hypothetical protein
VRCRRNWNYVLTVATLVAVNVKAIVAPVVRVGGVCGWREFGVMLSVLCWCI